VTASVRLFRIAAAMALTAAIAEVTPLRAQEQPAPGGRGDREQVRPAELILTDAQYGPFVTRLKRLQENRRRNNQLRNRLLQDLRLMTAPDAAADENAMREKLRALREHTLQSAAALQRDTEAVDEVLDVRQQARFRLLEERIERQKLDLLMRSRRGAAPPAGGRGQKPPGLQ
jgi:hypothetical protein